MLPVPPLRARVLGRALVGLALAGAALIPTAGGAQAASSGNDDAPAPVVIVGVGGLHWSDVDRVTTPELWHMVETGSVGSISVRTGGPVACPLDAWSTLSAGQRVELHGSEQGESADAGTGAGSDADSASGTGVTCPALPHVEAATTDVLGPARVAQWSELQAATAGVDGSTALGTVGSRIEEASCGSAVGPGAALMLADADGTVRRYAQAAPDVDAAGLAACPVTVIDAGSLSDDRSSREAGLRALDAELSEVASRVLPGTRVLVAGVAESPAGESGLQAVVEWQRGGGSVGWLTSQSTRRTGIVTLADLAATAVEAAGGQSADLDGSPIVVESERRPGVERTIENRRYLTEMTTIAPHLLPIVLGVVGVAGLAALAVTVVAARRRRAPAAAVRRVVVATLLLGACTPVGANLGALSRWWVRPAPQFVATASYVLASVLVALVAWGLSRLVRPSRWRLAGATAGLVWAVLTVDGVTGTPLQQGSILGTAPTLGARYFGFGNTTFGVYAAAALVLAGALAAACLRPGRGTPRAARTRAVGVVLAVGVVTVAVDGWPTFGADFGGVVALVPAFVLLALGVGGGAITLRRVVVALAGAVALAVVIALVDWARPGRSTHLGLFVRRVLEGDAPTVVADKLSGAWATVTVPVGALAALACAAVCVALVGPDRVRPTLVRRAYESWPLLRPVLLAVVVAAVLGSLLNDSGVVVAVTVLGVAGAVLVSSGCADAWAPLPDGPQFSAPPLRRMPAVVAATGAGLLVALLLVAAAVPPAAVAAGDVTGGRGAAAVPAGRPVVLVGTSGLAWSDVDPMTTPTLWGLLRGGAAAAGVAPGVVGASARCDSAGWLALSAGVAPVTGEVVDGAWTCAPLALVPGAQGADVVGWSALKGLQSRSAYRPDLGLLGTSLADGGVCATGVGTGAALALADSSGSVARYRTLDDALADPADAFSCPLTLVDAGTATPAGQQPDADTVQAVDATVRRVLAAVPAGATVMLVDVGGTAPGRPVLGAGLVNDELQRTAGLLSTPSTHWLGVVRLLDVPTTLLTAVGLPTPDEFTGSAITVSGDRLPDAETVVAQLESLTVRDHALRGVSGTVTGWPMYVSLAVVLLAALAGPLLARRRPGLELRLRRVADGVLLLAASVPAAAYLMTTWSWWRFADPSTAMWVALGGSTVLVAACGALVPRRPAVAGPGTIAVLTYALLTLDALLGTPLHRGSPLGPAPTLGGRYYGFGNPTYSIYAVAALFGAAALGTWLRHLGLRRTAVAVATLVCGSAFVVDLWPSLGADVGGGLVLLPAGVIVVLAVAGVAVTWRRLLTAAVVGVVLVGGIAVADWRRPAADRTHLGTFVQSVVDGTAWQTISRKGGYALATVTSGPTVWVTAAVLVLVVAAVWPRTRVRVRGWARVRREWPPAQQVVAALLVASIGGSLVNDYGLRIAAVVLTAAIPLFGMLGLRSAPLPGSADYPSTTFATSREPA